LAATTSELCCFVVNRPLFPMEFFVVCSHSV
jgi:hypothetical protein